LIVETPKIGSILQEAAERTESENLGYMMNFPSQVPLDDRRPGAVLRFGRAWLALAAALALHVTDEALTNFLACYNPTVQAIRDRLPWIPLPTFSFRVWITGLATGIALLFLLSPAAFRGARWITVVAIPFSVMMIGNGLGHVGSSIYMGRFMPGVYSSPILIAASLWVLVSALRLLRISPGKFSLPQRSQRQAGGAQSDTSE
jgi:hypothetical protein